MITLLTHLLLACGSSEPPAAPVPDDPEDPLKPAPGAKVKEGKGAKALPETTTGPTDVPARRTQQGTLQDVKVKESPRGDRVVFEFTELPGYRIEYIDQVLGCASGEPEQVAGNAWLQVQMRPAVAHTAEGNPTVPFREKEIGLGHVKAIRSTCDFESDVTWVIGLDAKTPYRVIEAKDPVRLVIEFP